MPKDVVNRVLSLAVRSHLVLKEHATMFDMQDRIQTCTGQSHTLLQFLHEVTHTRRGSDGTLLGG